MMHFSLLRTFTPSNTSLYLPRPTCNVKQYAAISSTQFRQGAGRQSECNAAQLQTATAPSKGDPQLQACNDTSPCTQSPAAACCAAPSHALLCTLRMPCCACCAAPCGPPHSRPGSCGKQRAQQQTRMGALRGKAVPIAQRDCTRTLPHSTVLCWLQSQEAAAVLNSPPLDLQVLIVPVLFGVGHVGICGAECGRAQQF